MHGTADIHNAHICMSNWHAAGNTMIVLGKKTDLSGSYIPQHLLMPIQWNASGVFANEAYINEDGCEDVRCRINNSDYDTCLLQ